MSAPSWAAVSTNLAKLLLTHPAPGQEVLHGLATEHPDPEIRLMASTHPGVAPQTVGILLEEEDLDLEIIVEILDLFQERQDARELARYCSAEMLDLAWAQQHPWLNAPGVADALAERLLNGELDVDLDYIGLIGKASPDLLAQHSPSRVLDFIMGQENSGEGLTGPDVPEWLWSLSSDEANAWPQLLSELVKRAAVMTGKKAGPSRAVLSEALLEAGGGFRRGLTLHDRMVLQSWASPQQTPDNPARWLEQLSSTRMLDTREVTAVLARAGLNPKFGLPWLKETGRTLVEKTNDEDVLWAYVGVMSSFAAADPDLARWLLEDPRMTRVAAVELLDALRFEPTDASAAIWQEVAKAAIASTTPAIANHMASDPYAANDPASVPLVALRTGYFTCPPGKYLADQLVDLLNSTDPQAGDKLAIIDKAIQEGQPIRIGDAVNLAQDLMTQQPAKRTLRTGKPGRNTGPVRKV